MPDRVCVEIDAARYRSLVEQNSWSSLNLGKVLRERKGFLLFANLILSSFQRRLGLDLGVKPGEEMLQALRVSEELGIPHALCDRDIQVTLRRAWGRSNLWNKNKMLATMLTSVFVREKLSEDDLERLKAYDWPGSVRELQNIVERALILSRGDSLVFPDLVAVDSEQGEVAGAYTPDQLVPRTCNAKNAVVHVLTVAEVVETKKLAPKLAEVGNFDMRHLENLRPLAWATWHCVFQLDSAQTAEGKRQVDPQILERAAKRRKRMLSMLSYHLEDDPAVARELAAIKSGSGHLDVAGDLTRLTPLFERHHDLLSRDPTHYNPDDLEGAPADAQAIVQSLAESPESAHWRDQLDRAFTALAVERARQTELTELSDDLFYTDLGLVEVPVDETEPKDRPTLCSEALRIGLTLLESVACGKFSTHAAAARALKLSAEKGHQHRILTRLALLQQTYGGLA